MTRKAGGFNKLFAVLTAGALSVTTAGCGILQERTSGSSRPSSDLVQYDEGGDDSTGSVTGASDESSKEDTGSGTEKSSRGSEAEETLMVYMVGSDLESQAGAATQDLKEMAASGYDADRMNVIVCAGGSNHWWNSSVSSDSLNVYEMKNKDVNSVYAMQSDNMGDSGTVTEFMNYAYENYPAEHYGMIFWNHGGGAVLGYGADETHNYDMLSVAELKNGIAGSELADSQKMDFIGFDACMMGMIEVADALSDCADYMIASEEVESSSGWDYSCLDDITDNKAYEGDKAAEYFIHAFQLYYDHYGSYSPDYSLSCVDLKKIPDVVNRLESLVTSADNSLRAGEYSKIAKSRDNAKAFGMVSADSFYDYIDLYSLSDSMKEQFPNECSDLQASLENAVVINGSNISQAHGIAIYFPFQNKEYADQWVTEYEKNGFSQTYISFIKDFVKTLEGETLYDWNIGEVTPSQENNTSAYYVQLTEDQVANFAHANASAWQADDEDTYICWVNSRNTTLSDDGKLRSKFDGKIFYLTDSNGESIPCCATEIEWTDEYRKFAIPVMINLMDPDNSKSAYIHVKVDNDHPSGVICGIYNTLDADGELYPDKTLIEIKDGDSITPFLFARDIVFNDDQTVAPFEQWKVSSGVGAEMTVHGDFSVQLKTNEETSDYICLFYITDTQGNQYYTNYLKIPASEFSQGG
ncbi:MAG: clostripain-related cysteine peptidase [Bilifractor sp.]|jgi:hypothetical protein